MRVVPSALLNLVVLLVAAFASTPAPAAAQSSAPGDPAAAAVQRCRSSNLVQERRCYEGALFAHLRESGAGAALELLDRLAALDSDVRREGHMYAHGIGIAALRSPEEVGRVFASCTPAYQSGCYHGVIQSYFLAVQRGGGDITTETADALCRDYRWPERNSWLLFQCTHGLGHGLAILYGHDLPRALRACELLSRPDERESCYGGAFMENIVHATHPHHAVADRADHAPGTDHGAGHSTHGSAQAGHGSGHGDHGAAQANHGSGHGDHGPAQAGSGHANHGQGHGGAAQATAAPFRALDPNDLHYPCSTMEQKYLDACYTIQTAAILFHTGHDMRRTAEECGRAPESVRRTCFISLGRDVSSIAVEDPERAVRLCSLAQEAFRPACNVGVVQALVNLNADPARGMGYCRLISAPESKRACYRAVGDQASVMPNGDTRRRDACRGAEEGYVEACLDSLAMDPDPAATETPRG